MKRIGALGLLSGLWACIEIEPIEPIYPTTDLGSGTSSGSDTGSSDDPRRDSLDETGRGSDTGTGTGTGSTGVPPEASSGGEGACVAGQEGCPCTPGGSCDPGLDCLSGFCVDVDGGCPVGSEGCP